MMLSKMAGEGIIPKVVTYSSIIHGLCDLGRWKEVKEFVKEMFAGGILPNRFTYGILLDAFCKEGNVKETKSVLAVMMQKNVAHRYVWCINLWILCARIDGESKENT